MIIELNMLGKNKSSGIIPVIRPYIEPNFNVSHISTIKFVSSYLNYKNCRKFNINLLILQLLWKVVFQNLLLHNIHSSYPPKFMMWKFFELEWVSFPEKVRDIMEQRIVYSWCMTWEYEEENWEKRIWIDRLHALFAVSWLLS